VQLLCQRILGGFFLQELRLIFRAKAEQLTSVMEPGSSNQDASVFAGFPQDGWSEARQASS
jgi:hypothetical protein